MLSVLMQSLYAVAVLTTVEFKLPVEVVDSKICDGPCQLPSVGQNRIPSSHFCHRGEATLDKQPQVSELFDNTGLDRGRAHRTRVTTVRKVFQKQLKRLIQIATVNGQCKI